MLSAKKIQNSKKYRMTDFNNSVTVKHRRGNNNVQLSIIKQTKQA